MALMLAQGTVGYRLATESGVVDGGIRSFRSLKMPQIAFAK